MSAVTNKNITPFSISSWIGMAHDDLHVAKLESVSPFIRCYHAQQAIEKMLKAAFVVAAGKFHAKSNKLMTDQGKQFCNKTQYNIPNCAWELDNVKFPAIHNLVNLWKKLGKYDMQAFGPLEVKQMDFMNKITKCAVDYRYPYFSQEVGMHSCVPAIETKNVVEAADQLFNDLYDYISRKAIASEAEKNTGDDFKNCDGKS